MRKFLLTSIMGTGLAITSITPAMADTNNILGTGMGAALGGFVGSQIARGDARLYTTAAGVILGGVIGNGLTQSSYPSHSYAPAAYASPYTAPPSYYYPTRYVPNYVAPPAPPVQPVTYLDSYSDSYCREYSQEVRIGNRIQESFGTACLQPDGSWRVVSQ